MNPERRSPAHQRAAELTAATPEPVELRAACWRMRHEVSAMRDTVEVLRAGANTLAIDNATLKIENEHLRACLQAVTAELG